MARAPLAPAARLADHDRAPLVALPGHRGDMDRFALEQAVECGPVGGVVCAGRLAQGLRDPGIERRARELGSLHFAGP